MDNKKSVLVTGGGKGLGCEIANRYGRLGYSVFIFYPKEADLSDNLDVKIRDGAILVDFTHPENIYEGFDKLSRVTNKLDVLVNNAGIYPRKTFPEMTLSDWYSVININLTAAFLCSQQVVKFMMPDKRTYITNISSDAALLGPKKGVHYAASKAGLIGLTKSMANALADQQINVNAVLPGIVDTDQSQLSQQKRREHELLIPFGSVANKGDIAKVVTALSSGDMDYITGQKIIIDGGRNPI